MKQGNEKKASSELPKRPVKAEPCLFCGEMTLCHDYIINPGADHELPCCSEECLNKAKAFVDYDSHHRILFYGILFVLVVANLFLFGFKIANRFIYLPMLGICIATCVYPLVFTRYERYQKYGISKTRTIIRVIAALVAAFAVILIVNY